jgi:hypothetical protein
VSAAPGARPTPTGVAVWSSAAWREDAVAWLDEQLAVAGIERTGEIEQPHVRPWATVLRAPTREGPVWLKAAGPGTAFEVRLYELLARVTPARVLTPIATDSARGWIVLPDGGPSIGERLRGEEASRALADALVAYGELQRELMPHVEELLALGVADMRPAKMPERFEEALEVTRAEIEHGGSPEDRAMHDRVTAMRAQVADWCRALAASAVPASLDHNDLHAWNVLGHGAGGVRFYDWGDSVVAHPFAAMLVPLGMLQQDLTGEAGTDVFTRARDAYLEVFSDLAHGEDLASTLELACRVAKVARVLTWERALRTAREQGEEVPVDWATAPSETLASLLDESYLGGA